MKKSIKVPIYTLCILLFFIVSFPKENFYYFMEQQLKKQQWIVSGEHIEDNLFSLRLHEGYLSHQRKSYAYFESSKVSLFGVDIMNLALYDKNAQKYLPSLEHLNIYYSMLNPMAVMVQGNGQIGEIEGYIDLSTRRLNFSLRASKYMKKHFRNSLNTMKLKEGRYYYEYQL